MKAAEVCFSKYASSFGVAIVTKGGGRRLKINFVLQISTFKRSENLKSVAQGVLEIFEEVYLGRGVGGGGWGWGGWALGPWLG